MEGVQTGYFSALLMLLCMHNGQLESQHGMKDLSQLATCGESRVNAIIQRYTRTCIRDPGDT